VADNRLRELERAARAGDRCAMAELLAHMERCGVPVSKKPHRPMTDDEVTMAEQLARCSFSPGTWDKRFARALGAQAAAMPPWITSKQTPLLRDLVRRYRRQLPERVVALAELAYDHGCATCLRFGEAHAPWCGAHPAQEKRRERDALGMFAPPEAR
jgi:hypothetical protein